MADVKVGDRVKVRIEYGMEGGTLLPAQEGTVVYVHPEGRLYTVEFEFPGEAPGKVRRFRESYLLPPPEDKVAERVPYGMRSASHYNSALSRALREQDD